MWEHGLKIILRLNEAGFAAYLVGGCVRDRLLGRQINDIDIATSAKPEQVMALFVHVLPTGLKHGTVTVIDDGKAFEVTTFRLEGSYKDARRPDAVAFIQEINHDLTRRDFTMNAMAFGADGQLLDPFLGQVALKQRMIKCVGDPVLRFQEDALRMMRAIRFSADLDFAYDPDLWKAIREQAFVLKQVSMERVANEWEKMLCGKNPEKAMDDLMQSTLIDHLKDPLPPAFYVQIQRYNEKAERLAYWKILSHLKSCALRWAAFCVGLHLEERETNQVLHQLRLSGKRVRQISEIVACLTQLNKQEGDWDKGIVSLTFIYGHDFVSQALLLGELAADEEEKNRKWYPLRQYWTDLPITCASELAVNGVDLLSFFNRIHGKWIAETLFYLWTEVTLRNLPNEKKLLLESAKRWMETNDAH